jgi:hypothetical protein
VLDRQKEVVMKKYLLSSGIAVALFLAACQNPVGVHESSGVEVAFGSVDAVTQSSYYPGATSHNISYYASYQIDSLKIPVKSIVHITMICDYDRVSIGADSVVYGKKVNALRISSPYNRTVYAFGEFITVNGDTLRDAASWACPAP